MFLRPVLVIQFRTVTACSPDGRALSDVDAAVTIDTHVAELAVVL